MSSVTNPSLASDTHGGTTSGATQTAAGVTDPSLERVAPVFASTRGDMAINFATVVCAHPPTEDADGSATCGRLGNYLAVQVTFCLV